MSLLPLLRIEKIWVLNFVYSVQIKVFFTGIQQNMQIITDRIMVYMDV